MATFTLELPEPIVQQVQARGISRQRLQEVLAHFIRIYLQEYDTILEDLEDTLEARQIERLWQEHPEEFISLDEFNLALDEVEPSYIKQPPLLRWGGGL